MEEKIMEKKFFCLKTNRSILEVIQGFQINRIVLNFNNYDERLEQGERITDRVRIYLDIPKASYIGHMMSDSVVYGKKVYTPFSLKAVFLKASEGDGKRDFPEPVYEAEPMGSIREGKVTARKFAIRRGDRYTFVLEASDGPGEKTAKGGFIARYSSKNAYNRVLFPLDEVQGRMFGYSLLDAVGVYNNINKDSFKGDLK